MVSTPSKFVPVHCGTSAQSLKKRFRFAYSFVYRI